MPLTLYVTPPSPRAFKVLLTAEYLGLDYMSSFVDIAAGAHRTDEFAAINPNKRIPALDHDGFRLWEANAVVEYLGLIAGDRQFMPHSTPDRLGVTKWLYWDAADWDRACATLIFEHVAKPRLGLGPPDQAVVARELAASHGDSSVNPRSSPRADSPKGSVW